jgi:hypothetical protein
MANDGRMTGVSSDWLRKMTAENLDSDRESWH